jgi:hypothetical protein
MGRSFGNGTLGLEFLLVRSIIISHLSTLVVVFVVVGFVEVLPFYGTY